jgi:hypothetical protein
MAEAGSLRRDLVEKDDRSASNLANQALLDAPAIWADNHEQVTLLPSLVKAAKLALLGVFVDALRRYLGLGPAPLANNCPGKFHHRILPDLIAAGSATSRFFEA